MPTYEEELAYCRKQARITAPPFLLYDLEESEVGCTTVFELPHDWKGLIHVSDQEPVKFQAVNLKLPFVTERYDTLKELMERTKIEFGTRYDPFEGFIRERTTDEGE